MSKQWITDVTLSVMITSDEKPTEDQINQYVCEHIDDLLLEAEMSDTDEYH